MGFNFIKAVREYDNASEMLWGDVPSVIKSKANKAGCTVEQVHQCGGEGQGDDIHAVFKVTDSDGWSKFYRVQGWYASYNGADYDSVKEVKAVEKTITVWE